MQPNIKPYMERRVNDIIRVLQTASEQLALRCNITISDNYGNGDEGFVQKQLLLSLGNGMSVIKVSRVQNIVYMLDCLEIHLDEADIDPLSAELLNTIYRFVEDRLESSISDITGGAFYYLD
jgi:hypothetical protein